MEVTSAETGFLGAMAIRNYFTHRPLEYRLPHDEEEVLTTLLIE